MQVLYHRDLWDYKSKVEMIVVPVNKTIRQHRLIMGAGFAKQANERVQALDLRFANAMERAQHNVCRIIDDGIWYIAFPTKCRPQDRSSLALIELSCKQLRSMLYTCGEPEALCLLPAVGCGCGKLSWSEVEPVLREHLPENNFVVVLQEKGLG